MQLAELTWPAVQAYFAGRDDVLVPIGSTEQHGPTGLIGTDAQTAAWIAGDAGERTGVLVAPVIAFGMAQHHLAFAGTISLRPSTLIAVVQDVVRSLVRHGARRVLFVNGHGGNITPLRTAFSEFHAEGSLAGGERPSVALELWSFFEGPRFRAAARELYGAADGAHATASEIAITQAGLPHAFAGRVGQVLDPRVAPAMTRFGDAEDFRRRFPDGRAGSDPSLARPDHGVRLRDAAVEDLVALLGSANTRD